MKIKLISMLLAAISLPALGADALEYGNTLYRNGGHFGDANSDVGIERGELVIAAAPAAPELPAASASYGNTLYRNDGHFGNANSDERIERGELTISIDS